MTLSNLFAILIVLFGIIGFVCLLIILKNYGDAPKSIKLAKLLLSSIGLMLLAIFYLPDRNRFAMKFESSEWEELNVPQIDSNMFLNRWHTGTQYYATWSNDSIRYNSKIVEYDLFDLFKIQDLFINEYEDIELVMIYIKPNIIREEERLNILQKRDGFNIQQLDTLTHDEAKNILKQWGFGDELFKSKRNKYSGK